MLHDIELKGQYFSFGAGKVIIDFNQQIRTMPIILEGSIKVIRLDEKGNELLLYYVSESESCAMTFTCCMQTKYSEIKAVVENDVEMVAVPVHLMDEWMLKYPSWKSFVMRTIQLRFNELLKTIDQIAFQRLDERLVKYLKEKGEINGTSIINSSHEQIAHDLATSRVVISRLLKTLENEGKLLLYRNQIKLLREL